MKWKIRNKPGYTWKNVVLFNGIGISVILNHYADLNNSAIHNHRRNLCSIILWGGYWETIYLLNQGVDVIEHSTTMVRSFMVIHRDKNVIHRVYGKFLNYWTLHIYYGNRQEQEVFSVNTKNNFKNFFKTRSRGKIKHPSF